MGKLGPSGPAAVGGLVHRGIRCPNSAFAVGDVQWTFRSLSRDGLELRSVMIGVEGKQSSLELSIGLVLPRLSIVIGVRKPPCTHDANVQCSESACLVRLMCAHDQAQHWFMQAQTALEEAAARASACKSDTQTK